jgi:hypothetical protein
MGQLIKFPNKDPGKEEVLKVKFFSDAIDRIVLNGIRKQRISPQEVAGVLSHRLGSLICNIEQKNKLWLTCSEILKQQAKLD